MTLDALLRPLGRMKPGLGRQDRRGAIVLLACALALSSADLAAVGAMAPELRRAFGLNNAQIGLLVAVSTLVGALASLPVGALTDRVRRMPLLAGSIALWGVAMIVCGASASYSMLLIARVALGVVTATAGPTIASLTGDLFPSQDRARVYGYLLAGELVGAGVGFLVAGTLAGLLSWRAGFWALAPPALALSILVARLPEPSRRGEGADRASAAGEPEDLVERKVAEAGTEPIPDLVLRRDPRRLSLAHAVRYILRIRTNIALIAASALGYFYLAGLQTFAVEFLRGRYGLGQSVASVLVVAIGAGGLAGALLGGRLADGWLERGRVDARLLVAAGAYVLSAAMFVPAYLIASLAAALPFYLGAVALLAATNPPLDAARLDVLPPRLWGRGEGTRTLVREIGVALAPLAFGLLSDAFAGGSGTGGAIARGLQYTFLIMLAPLVLAGVILLWAAKGYPADVATAVASERAGLAGRPPGQEQGL